MYSGDTNGATAKAQDINFHDKQKYWLIELN